MIKRFLLLVFVIMGITGLWAQYDERQILIQQAANYYNLRQYTQAEQLYRQILDRWPNDQTSVLQLLNIAYQTGDVDKAEAILKTSGRYLPPLNLLEHEIQILVHRGKPEQAWNKAMQSLELAPNDQNRYRILASFFERRGFYEQVLNLYELGRQKWNNPELFALEYANTALNFQRYELAMAEYLRWLNQNPANLYFINNQCKIILEADPGLIDLIREAARTGNGVMKELLANTLVSRKLYNDALDIYKEMGRDKLLGFANQQFVSMNDEVAEPAFEWLQDTESDVFRKSQYTFNLAQIGFRNQRYAHADSLINLIVADSLMNLPQNRWRSPIGYQARKLKTELALILSRDPHQALDWIDKARAFSRNSYENQETELEAARLLILAQDYEQAKKRLNIITEARLKEEKDYLTFVAALLDNQAELADSLMNDFVINWPEGTFTNDAIYLMMHVLGLEGDARTHFLTAYRRFQLKDPFSVSMLITLFAQNEDEELLTLAAEWAVSLGEKNQALDILSHDWQDPLSGEYAAWLILFLQESSAEQQRQAREFLKKNPNSIFSPSFRTHLMREVRGRPELN